MKRKAKKAMRVLAKELFPNFPVNGPPKSLYLEIEEDVHSVTRLAHAAWLVGQGALDCTSDPEIGYSIKQIAEEMERYLKRIHDAGERDCELQRNLKATDKQSAA